MCVCVVREVSMCIVCVCINLHFEKIQTCIHSILSLAPLSCSLFFHYICVCLIPNINKQFYPTNIFPHLLVVFENLPKCIFHCLFGYFLVSHSHASNQPQDLQYTQQLCEAHVIHIIHDNTHKHIKCMYNINNTYKPLTTFHKYIQAIDHISWEIITVYIACFPYWS